MFEMLEDAVEALDRCLAQLDPSLLSDAEAVELYQQLAALETMFGDALMSLGLMVTPPE